MTVKEAIRIAGNRVQFNSYGKRQGLSQYQVNHYSEKHRAWWEGTMTSDRASALSIAWEHKVCIALELLGVEEANEIAAHEAMVARDQPKHPDWRGVVRALYRKEVNHGTGT